MELSEYLTRIDLKGATNTRFKRVEEKDVRITRNKEESTEKVPGIMTYTHFDSGAMGATGFIRYDKDFPSQIFEMNPEKLKNIVEGSDSIAIEESFLVGRSKKYGYLSADLKLLTKFKAGQGNYDNPPITLKTDFIETLILRESYVDSNYTTIQGDGKKIVFTFHSKIGTSKAEVPLECDVKVEARLESSLFMEILKIVKDMDAKLYIDVQTPENRKKSPVKLEIVDKDALISYFITEVAVSESNKPSVEKKKKGEKKEKKEENSDAKESEKSDSESLPVEQEKKEEIEEDSDQSLLDL